jgi:ribonuclease G
VAKIDGYIISIAGAASNVGEKRMVRIDQVGRTAASALLLDDSGEVVAPSDGAGARKEIRARRRTRADLEEGRAGERVRARARGRRAPADSEDAEARREAGLRELPTEIDSEPEDEASGQEASEAAAGANGATRRSGSGEGGSGEGEDGSGEGAGGSGDGAGDGIQSKPRRRGRRGGRRRSAARAKASPK